ncbi:MAG: class I adenylate-forming enzyme family protein [Bauldia sp.]
MGGTATENLSGPPVLLDLWDRWNGAIACAFTDRTWSSASLRAAEAAIAGTLLRLGLGPHDAVGLMLANTVAFPAALLALLRIGCNPLLIHAGAQRASVERVVREYGVRWLLHDFIDGVSTLEGGGQEVIDRVDLGGVSLSVVATGVTAGGVAVPGAGVVLHPTSGTYGSARYCMRNQTAAVAEARNYTETIGLYRAAKVTVTTPLNHAFAFGFGLASAILTDSTLCLDIAFNPRRLLRTEKAAPSDILAIVPPMARTLADLARDDPGRMMARSVFYAGAPIDAGHAREFEATFGVPLFAILGTTETGAISSSFGGGDRPAGVGRPLRNVEVEIRNTEPYRRLGRGIGELFVRSPSMMQGYLPSNERTDAAAFFRTGDLGRIDAAGAIILTGRIKDIINLGGMKVDPAEVEAVLLAQAGVTDAAVYPGLRDDGQEFVQAAVAGTVDGAELRRSCAAELDAHKVPSTIHIVDRIPRTPSGKCLKVECPGYPMALAAVPV